MVTESVADSGRRRHARRDGVAAARDRLPDVEERGTASEGNAGGGRRDRATRGVRSGWRRVAGDQGRPAAGVTHARQRDIGARDSRRKTEDPVVTVESTGTLL
jgi:hypothetical protein